MHAAAPCQFSGILPSVHKNISSGPKVGVVSYVNLNFFFIDGFHRCLVHNNFVDCSENFAGLHCGCKM